MTPDEFLSNLNNEIERLASEDNLRRLDPLAYWAVAHEIDLNADRPGLKIEPPPRVGTCGSDEYNANKRVQILDWLKEVRRQWLCVAGADLPTCVQNAYACFKTAELNYEGSLQDREAHEWLVKHGIPKLDDYVLPSFDTWARHLRTARKALGEQKHSPRAGRTGRSIVRADSVEYQDR